MGVAMILDELAREVFGFLCHQDPARTWEPGGAALATCARCVGVYAGFALAVPMLAVGSRLRGKAMLWAHGALVVQVAVFGFHLLPAGATLRMLSGQMFAVGVMCFLFRAVRQAESSPPETTGWRLIGYVLGTVAAVIGLQCLVRLDQPWAATVVDVLALVGLGGFGGLAAVLLVEVVGYRRGAGRLVVADGAGGS